MGLIFALQKLAVISRIAKMEETMPVVTNMGHEFEWANLMLAPPWSTTGRDSSNFTDAQLNGTSNFYASYESGCGVTTQKCTFF